MEQANIIIIGAGVVGLAIAAELSATEENVILLEQHSSFGQETSSRSSEVIHAGIYYRPGSLKARFCVEGKRLLYEFCAAAGVPHRRIGKWIIASNDEEIANLEFLLGRARENGVEDIDYLPASELGRFAPALRLKAGLWSRSTGIVDSHALMKQLEHKARQQGVLVSYNSKVIALEKSAEGYALDVADTDGDTLRLAAPVVINCAGLGAHRISEMLGLGPERAEYRVQYWKAEFYKARNRRALPSGVLLYPSKGTDIGIHTVVDMQGEVKLGPLSYRAEPVVDYSIDSRHRQVFYDTCKPFFPLLELDDLEPDMAGISPAIEAPADDWTIRHESDHGLPGFVNLVGMKSPALTACLSIARHVRKLLYT